MISHFNKRSITPNNVLLLFPRLLHSLKPKWYFEDTDQVRVVLLQWLPAALRSKTTVFKITYNVILQLPSPASSPTDFHFVPCTGPHLHSLSSFTVLSSFLTQGLLSVFFSSYNPLFLCTTTPASFTPFILQRTTQMFFFQEWFLCLVFLLSQHLCFSFNMGHYNW